jgi:hypothetical protein
MVTVPDLEAPLLLYVAASEHAVSGILAHEKEEGAKAVQRPVYFVSKALSGAKLNYTEIEKNHICSPDLLKKAETLLSWARNHSANIPATRRHSKKQRSLRQNRQMGHRAIPI